MEFIYFLISFSLIVAATMVISTSNPMHALFWLVIVFLHAAILLFTLKFEFLALMLILIYIGAITILFIFVIMLLDLIHSQYTSSFLNLIPILSIGSALTLLQLGVLYTHNTFPTKEAPKGWDLGSRAHLFVLGNTLYTEYVMFFFLVTIALGTAMLGVILLTLESGSLLKSQKVYDQHHRKTTCK